MAVHRILVQCSCVSWLHAIFLSSPLTYIADLGWTDHQNYAWQLAGKLSATGEIYNEFSNTSKNEMPVVQLSKFRVMISVYAQFSKTAFMCQKSSKANREDLCQIHDWCAYQMVNSLICKCLEHLSKCITQWQNIFLCKGSHDKRTLDSSYQMKCCWSLFAQEHTNAVLLGGCHCQSKNI